MPNTLLMPALSPTMESGKLGRWLVPEGTRVQSGDLLAEIETDKATMEFEAIDDGILAKLLVADGAEDIKVNTPIAILVADGEEYDPAELTAADLVEANPPSPTPVQHEPATDKASCTEDPPAIAASVPQDPAMKTPSSAASRRIFASPLARRLAAQQHIDLASVQGSGPHGRIVKADILEAASRARTTESGPTGSPVSGGLSFSAIKAIYAKRSNTLLEIDGMRRTVAARLSESKQTVPHFYLRRTASLDALLASRTALNERLAADGIKVSINDFIIGAVAMALKEIPAANAIWAEGRIMQFTASDIAVAVAVEGGLYTPVLFDAETKSIREISVEMKDLATRARARSLKPDEYLGGCCAISNLGMYGIEDFDAVINPPHSSILAVGAGMRQPVIDASGSLGIATRAALNLSVDHRVIDGAAAAQFLNAIVSHIEAPILLRGH
ncbi:MAG: pyruvate dehydrogenase complex dihydrolipoamide acetyltransferase [Rhodobacteraceae bacterium]|nr:pyruvate dehydrogenase complex dihydrolipoamide acetyltransferase [Paracoccaceae bacterium]